MTIAVAIIAQATLPAPQVLADGGMDWKFWVMALIAVVSVIEAFFSPFIAWSLRRFADRLKEGDEKFEQHALDINGMTRWLKGIDSDLLEIKGDVKAIGKEANSITVEGQGSVSELRTEIERDFVRKSDFRDLARRMDDQHRESMHAMREIEKRLK